MALDDFKSVIIKNDILLDKKIKISKKVYKSTRDVWVINAIRKGKSLTSIPNSKNENEFKVLPAFKESLKVPNDFRHCFVKSIDFKGKVYNAIEISDKVYVEIKLANSNKEVMYYIFEFNVDGEYLDYYYSYLIY